MATILLGALGASIGAGIGGTIAGIGAAAIGRAVGSAVGRMIDQSIIAIITPDKQIEGPEVGKVSVSAPREGEMLARGAGWQRLPARMIWPDELLFSQESETVVSPGKGAQNRTSTTTYYAAVTIAIAIREGRTDTFGRVWADGSLIDLDKFCDNVTWYKGTATQDPDPTIEAVEGVGNVPDWRGITYVVLEGFNLGSFGNRIPQLEFETFAATRGAPEIFTGLAFAPTAGEFGFDPEIVTEETSETVEEADGPETVVIADAPVNNNASAARADMQVALDMLAAQHPQVTRIALQVPWFGDDLRAGECEIKPRVELDERSTAPYSWAVGGVTRGTATLVAQVDGVRAYAGTPSDASVVRAIGTLKAAGYTVSVMPVVLMDIATGNGLADPYGGVEQPAFPLAEKITCHPAPGEVGTVDKTATAAAQVSAFFGGASAADFSVAGGAVSYSGSATDWGYNRFVLHCAALIDAAGGADDLMFGHGLGGISRVRSDSSTYPAAAALQNLLGELRDLMAETYSGDPEIVRSIPSPTIDALLPYRNISSVAMLNAWYIGDAARSAIARTGTFSEGGVDFTPNLDSYILEYASGTQAYIFADVDLPAGQYRVGVSFEHAQSPATNAGLRNWAVHEGIDGSGLFGGDLTAGKSVAYYPVSGLVNWTFETYSGRTTGKGNFLRFRYYMYNYDFLLRDVRLRLNRLCGIGFVADWQTYGAHAPDDGSGDVFFPLDPVFAESELDFIAIEYAPPIADLRDGDAASPYDIEGLQAGIEAGEYYDYTYANDADRQARITTAISDIVYGEPWVFRAKDVARWYLNRHYPRPAGVRSGASTAWRASMRPLRLLYACPAIDRAANQPSVNSNPYATDAAIPHFSNGARDDDAQAAYLRAVVSYWADDGRGVVDAASSLVLGWDARPWPVYPHTDLWADAAAWPVGRSLTGRRIVDLAAWLSDELTYREIDFVLEPITGAIDGITITNAAGFGAVAGQILALFNLDASEIGGKVRITSRTAQIATVEIDLGAVVPLSDAERYKAPRGNPATLPRLAQLTHNSIAHDYDSNTVNSTLDVQGKGESQTDVPLLIDAQRAQALVRAQHIDMIVALDELECALPPSWLATTEPGRALLADTGSGVVEWLILSRDIGDKITLRARRLDRAALRQRPARRIGRRAPVSSSSARSVLALPDLPWLTLSDSAHDLRLAQWVDPSQGNVVQRSLSADTGFETILVQPGGQSLGVTTSALPAGPRNVWDRGTKLRVRMFSGGLVSKTEALVRSGANWLAVRNDAAANIWEVLAFRDAELVAPGTYDLTMLGRGLRGSPIAGSVDPGALVAVLESLPFAGLEITDLGVPFYWAGGPSVDIRGAASWTQKQVTPAGAGLKPLAPSRLRGELVSGDLVLTWARQDRDPRAENLDRASVPMSEETEQYLITIGASTWSATSETTTILAGELPATPFDVTVQQISAEVGAGHAATLTVE